MIVYLDNSATTRQYDEVTDLMAGMARDTFGNPSSLHRLGLDAEKAVKEARKNVASAINASDDEIFFTSCGTESDNTVLMSLVTKRNLNSKKRIITTKVEHPAILEPCKKLEELGFDVVYLDVDDMCRIDPKQVENALNKDTVLISIMSVNNEAGTIMPIEEIAEIKDRFNKENKTSVLLHTDAVQALGKIRIDVKGNYKGVDLISASAHKIHGPKGMGFLYVRKGINLQPYLLGGGQEKHFRSGTENTAGIAGFGKACRLVKDNFEERTAKMTECREKLYEGLSKISDVRIKSPKDGVCSVLNCSFIGTRGEVILHTLEQSGIYVSTGSACSSNHSSSKGSHVLNAMGLKPKEIEGAIRFSLSEFNTPEEMDYTIEKVTEAVTKFRKLGTFR